mmetsp:Transcript_5002/g.7591  ORF Transcript_5002/g.7591 Transcript_5002/m.7591 type:complete len:562 (-) Transcript_5002:285-1970(-)
MGKKDKSKKGGVKSSCALSQTGRFSVWDPAGAAPQHVTPKKHATKKVVDAKPSSPAKEAKPAVDAEITAKVQLALLEEIPADTWIFAESFGVDHGVVVGALKSLEADLMLVSEPLTAQSWALTAEGSAMVCDPAGSPEFKLLSAVPASGSTTMGALEGSVGKDVVKLGMGPCMKSKWLVKGKDGISRGPKAGGAVDETKEKLVNLQASGGSPSGLTADDLKTLKRRQLISQVTKKSFKVLKGPDWALTRQKRAADLTRDMVMSGDWEQTKFKDYNFRTLGVPVGGGYLHPLLKVRAEFRRILMSMGFEEMPTSRWVEGCFWNFDSLFQPQSHPARDAHDTFFIKSPMFTNTVPEDYYEVVKNQHEKGGFGSQGYRYDFKREEAMKNILRTHTTAISAQMLYKLANQEGGFQPKKYFSIDRVFRNENMDATHLCEFHQVEGLVADYNLSLGDLIGIIKTFFENIGITKLRFKPAYNPYTEPSMEVFGFHPDLNKWTEIGNSGMFRPEMLRPMGLPEDVRVIAWGLSLERPTMIKYRISNIRDLFGHKVDLGQTRMAPICRFP